MGIRERFLEVGCCNGWMQCVDTEGNQSTGGLSLKMPFAEDLWVLGLELDLPDEARLRVNVRWSPG